jgi:hypothetical protein
MKLVELRQEADLQKLASDWGKLLCASASNIFPTWEWIAAWWSAYGAPGELRILAAYDELHAPVEHFAYPNGREEDFGQSNTELPRADGCRAALTTIWGANHRSTDRMELRCGESWGREPRVICLQAGLVRIR